MNYLHNDIKHENILIGLNGEKDLIYLIDFGLSTRFLDPKTQKHLPPKRLNKFTGNLLFASIS